MLIGYSPVVQALMGTIFTWALTAAGSALALVIKGSQVSRARAARQLLSPFLFRESSSMSASASRPA